MELPINYKQSNWSVRKQARELYTEQQKGLCCFCNKPLLSEPSDKVLKAKINTKLFPKSMFDYPVHLHHCHKNDMTIGAVHARCNAYMWQYLNQ